MSGLVGAKVVVVIPARGGSRRLPRKNIRPYLGKPLMQWAIEACQASDLVSAIYVSTEDEEIKQLASSLGVEVIDRPRHLAEDYVWTQEVLKHAARVLGERGVSYDVMARIQANSPQVQAEKIDEAIEKLLTHNLWEVFSVDEKGIEDAAIHVLRKECIWQEALSVYKGVVSTDYVDVHDAADLAALEHQMVNGVEAQSLAFFDDLEKKYIGGKLGVWYRKLTRQSADFYLWRWQRIIPLRTRWDAIVAASRPLRQVLYAPDGHERAGNMTVLDLGCGFGMYWPIMRNFGFRQFVGIDLYDLRHKESYLKATHAYLDAFCGDCITQVIMDDARNLSRHKLFFPRFDVVLAVATTSTKSGSTGITRALFDAIVQKYGSDTCIPVFVEGVSR